jgi:hypothetical protein
MSAIQVCVDKIQDLLMEAKESLCFMNTDIGDVMETLSKAEEVLDVLKAIDKLQANDSLTTK